MPKCKNLCLEAHIISHEIFFQTSYCLMFFFCLCPLLISLGAARKGFEGHPLEAIEGVPLRGQGTVYEYTGGRPGRVRWPPPRRDMNIQGFAGHPRPSRGAECSYPVPLKGSEPPRGDMNIQGVRWPPPALEGVAFEPFPGGP